MKKRYLFFLTVLLPLFSLEAQGDWHTAAENPAFIHRAIKQLTDVMVHDIYSPPVASRTYAYICVAGYEAALPGHPAYRSFAGQLHGLKSLPKPVAGKQYCYTLASVQAILMVGKTMVVSEDTVSSFLQVLLNKIAATGMPPGVYDSSLAYGQRVAAAIIAWAAADNYRQTRTFTKYSPVSDAALWKPTPPAYFKAVEPHWNKLRPFLLDSAQQCKPPKPTPFSADKKSLFYKEALAVRDVGLKLTDEQKAIANFWDCNPFKMNVNGHVMYASKKISPGGHWVNITRLACQQTGTNPMQTLEAYAWVAVTNADAFISCWDEKYRSVVIRPETYINQYIDGSWMPLIQTPPFPEYPSGHSVVSGAASVVLTKLFGGRFVYADSTEVEFGLPVRKFESFVQAANEAAISRFYGGIHFMPAINHGLEEGRRVGALVLRKLKTRKEEVAKN
jgi:hypothetical protein